MTISEFLSHLRSKEIKLWIEGDNLCYRAPVGALTSAVAVELAKRKTEILEVLRAASVVTLPISRTSRDQKLPLSFAQQRLWFLDQFEPESPFYNIAKAMRLNGPLNMEALQKSLDAILSRHEILRTNIAVMDGNPTQVITKSRSVKLSVIDLSQWSNRDHQAEMHRLVNAEARRPFNLSSDLMLRVTLLHLGENDHVLLLVMHHIASDAWSMGILYRELSALYQAFSTGEPCRLAELPIQYADFAIWQRQWLQGEVFEKQFSYWKRQLSGIPVLELPTDRPRPAIQTFPGGRQSLVLSKNLSNALKALSRKEGVTFFMTLLAAFQTLLHRYTGQEDIAVGSPIANRTRSEIEGLIGFFVNTLVLRTDLSGNPNFRELLARVRKVALGAYEHQDLPFEKIVEELKPERDLSHNPLFQIMFSLQNVPRQSVELPALTLRPVDVTFGTAKFDLTLFMIEEAGSLTASLAYNTDLFNDAIISRMLGHFQALLQGIVANPDRRLSDLPILSQAEKQRLLVEWNNTKRDYPRDKCIHQLFEDQAERSPDAVAAVFEDTQLTYGELNRRANRLAHYLRKFGVGPEVLVGICMERSLEMVVALLGILKAGGAYVPLDPTYPKERLAFMLQDTQASVLLTQQKLIESLPELQAKVVRLDTDWEIIGQQADDKPVNGVSAENVAYVIYTSGSTGKPKGVQIMHRSIARHSLNIQEHYDLHSRDCVLQFASLSFDASIEQIIPTLMSGAKLVIRSPSLWSSSECLQQISDRGITVANLPTSYWRQVVRHLANAGGPVSTVLRLVVVGGEAMLPEDVSNWQKTPLRDVRLLNAYGPTETTITATTFEITSPRSFDAAPFARVPIGRPLGDRETYILDAHGRLAPIGVPGELHIGGECLARGYLNLSELTSEKFVANPFSHVAGSRLYKTGDLARYRRDGNIEFLGRIDDQVKLRGYRIELGEIDSVLGRHPEVQECLTIIREDSPGDERLVAYVVSRHEPSPDVADLRSFLRQKLPDYMIPSAFVFLDSWPLTPNGKVDRKALPAPDLSRPELDDTFSAPRTPVEEIVAGIWAEVLKLDKVGIHDNFFDLGGHSLLATQVISRVQESSKVELPLRSLFESPTVAGLAKRIEESRRGKMGFPVLPILPMPRDGDIPLSFAQQRLWFLDHLEPNTSVYNIPSAQRLKGPLDIGALEQSLNEIVRRHEALRTTFSIIEGQPVQRISPSLSLSLPVIDLSCFPESEREDEARRLTNEEAQRPFDLSHGPLMRSVLLRLGNEDHVLLLTMHHIASDGWSLSILYRELSALYEAFSNGKPSPLESLPVQYADFAQWQREWLQGEVLETQLGYWKKQLENIQTLQLPTDRPRPGVQSYRGARQSMVLSRKLTEALKTLSRQQGVTLFMTLLAAFQTLLCRYTGQDDIAVGSPIAGRNRREIEGLIGFFVNTLVLHSDLSGNPSFFELLGRVRESSLEAYAHQDLPFEKLVEELQPERNLSNSPLFQVMFVLQNAPREALEFAGLTMSSVKVDTTKAKFDLTLSMQEEVAGLRASLQYSIDLFNEETITRMLGHFEMLLESIVADPDQRISDLPILDESEKRQLLVDWNNTDRDYPKDKCIHELFEAQVERSPNAVAVVFEDKQLTYRELNRRANQFAHHLKKLGVGPDVLVGICVERSLEMIVGVLAVLKAGGAYVPLDLSYPRERLAFLLEDAKVSVLLTQQGLLERLPEHKAEVVCLDAGWEAIARESGENLINEVTANNLAYVMYTSGSTGRPKGVSVTHQGVVRLVKETNYVELIEKEAFLQFAPLSFDASTFEIWACLLNGAKLVVFPPYTPSLEELGQALRRNQVTTLWLTSALFQSMVEDHMEALSGVKQLLAGGDVLPVPHVKRVLTELPGCRLTNGYGPTENTTFTCCYQMTSLEQVGDSVSIGRPIANTQVYILDHNLNPVPIGVSGELYIGGEGLARGYFNNSELTAEKFLPNPFGPKPGVRLYKTGDLARYLQDGNIEFLGRTDYQVKIRGFRIELGEIETVLAQHPAVQQAIVVAREDSPGQKQLVAYIVPNREQPSTATKLRSFLKTKLPDYMIPSAFVMLDALPLTPNGKVDRRTLPAPDQSRPDLKEAFVAPRTAVEQVLAGIWSQLLKLEQIGIHDNFFDLGGHSLLATQVISRVRGTFQVELPLRALFENPTVASLAVKVAEAQVQKDSRKKLEDVLDNLELLSDEDAERLIAQGAKEIEKLSS